MVIKKTVDTSVSDMEGAADKQERLRGKKEPLLTELGDEGRRKHKRQHNVAYKHHHEKDFRATIRSKDIDGVNVFGRMADKAGEAGSPNTENSGLLSLFHLLNHRVIFPFTPTITIGGHATYDEYSFPHTVYKYNAFKNAAPDDIQIVGLFVAQTSKEAEYLLAVMHFFRTLTKSYFGDSGANAVQPGTPPPVLFFNYMGKFQFRDVPVVISDYNYILEPDIDYIEVHGRDTRVPTEVTITVNLKHYYNPKLIRDTFDLEKFRTGELVTKGFV